MAQDEDIVLKDEDIVEVKKIIIEHALTRASPRPAPSRPCPEID